MEKCRWCFPSNSGGDEQGLNNSLIETFNDLPLKSLAREIVQNSLDAVLTGQKAIVEFRSFFLDRSEFPNIGELRDVMQKCQVFAHGLNNAKAEAFFTMALSVLSADKIPFLRISDFNTRGLRGSNKERGTDWSNLVRSTGASNKQGESGGSFGIGKGAPYACSALRTVFYSTQDCDGLMASQGVSRLTSFVLGKFDDGSDDIAQGVGYWGQQDAHKILPHTDMLSLDCAFQRKSSGTDIYIAGLRKEIHEDIDELQTTIINEVLDGFMLAIWQEKLEVRVNSFVINKDTLKSIIERLGLQLSPSTTMLYHLLSSPLTQWESFPIKFSNITIGSIKLAVSLRHDGNNKITMVRSTGMKILDKSGLCPTMRFVGIALIEGKQLNEWLIKLENPSHNRWEPNRHDPQTSKKLLTTIYERIKDKLNEHAEKAFSSNVDIEGAGEFLPDDLKAEGKQEHTADKVEVTNKIVSIERKVHKKVDSVAFLSTLEFGDELREKVEGSGSTIQGTDDEGFLHHGGKRHGNGERDPDDISFIDDGQPNGKQIALVKAKHMRVFCKNKDDHVYRLLFLPAESSKKGYISINKIAELTEKEPVRILRLINATSTLQVNGNKVGYFEFDEDKMISLEFQIDEQDYCSMEVKVYAYKG